jgi:hypothetical protein
MDEPARQEDPEEKTVTPAEVWDQLSPDVQERAISLLVRMAYKYALLQRKPVQDETEVTGEIPRHESKDQT